MALMTEKDKILLELFKLTSDALFYIQTTLLLVLIKYSECIYITSVQYL